MISDQTVKNINRHRRQPQFYKLLQIVDQKFNIALFPEQFYELGKGMFGKCFLGKICLKHGQTFQQHEFDDLVTHNKIIAIKVIPKDVNNANSEIYNHEIENLASLQNQGTANILKIFPFKYQTESNYYIFMEYCNNCTLSDLMNSRKKKDRLFSIFELIQIIIDLISGYSILKSKNILHNDLKPQNIFIRDKIFKLGDFGLSIQLNSQNRSQIPLGTLLYAAPQKLILKNKADVNHKADIFSLGLILYQIMFESHPYYNKKYYDQFKRLKYQELKVKDSQLSEKEIRKAIHLQYLELNTDKIQSHSVKLKKYDQHYHMLVQSIKKMVISMCSLDIKQRPSLSQITLKIRELNMANLIERDHLFGDLKKLSESELNFQLNMLTKYEVSVIEQNSVRNTAKIRQTQPITIERIRLMKQRLYITFQIIELINNIREQVKIYLFKDNNLKWMEFQLLVNNYCYQVNISEYRLSMEELTHMTEQELKVANRQDIESELHQLEKNDEQLIDKVSIDIESYHQQENRRRLKQFAIDYLCNNLIGVKNWIQAIAFIMVFKIISAEEMAQTNEKRVQLRKQIYNIEAKFSLFTRAILEKEDIEEGFKFIIENQKHFQYFYEIQE